MALRYEVVAFLQMSRQMYLRSTHDLAEEYHGLAQLLRSLTHGVGHVHLEDAAQTRRYLNQSSGVNHTCFETNSNCTSDCMASACGRVLDKSPQTTKMSKLYRKYIAGLYKEIRHLHLT